jgi:putative transposase
MSMPFNHHRRSIRLPKYDYASDGAYFVTSCAHDRNCLFGKIANDQMVLNECGKIVKTEWLQSSEMRREIELDFFVVMPNHFHGIVFLRGDDNSRKGDRPVAPTTRQPGPPPKSIGALIAGFKSAVTKRINESHQTPGMSVWQRNHYEHIIRDDDDLNRIREYIINKPAKWAEDEDNSENIKNRP